MQKLPLGLQAFSKVREGQFLYVDKTSAIYDVVHNGGYFFLSRPRRFGKSLLVNTMKELYLAHKHFFEGLWIEDKWDWEKKNPVILIDFSKIGFGQIGLEKALFGELERIYTAYDVPLKVSDSSNAFRNLIDALAEKFQQKVVVLIDEYDKPILEYLENLEKVEAQKETLKSFYSVLKGSDANLELVFITGVSKFAKVSIFSDLNNLTDLSTHKKYNELVGITQEELEAYFPEYLNYMAQELALSHDELLNKIKSGIMAIPGRVKKHYTTRTLSWLSFSTKSLTTIGLRRERLRF